MKMKMHLAARAPSEGARQLAQWTARQCGGDLELAAYFVSREGRESILGVSGIGLQRIIDGEIIPGAETLAVMWRIFGLTARMFNRPADGGWFDAQAMKLAA